VTLPPLLDFALCAIGDLGTVAIGCRRKRKALGAPSRRLPRRDLAWKAEPAGRNS
jgi:hypothetical protein